MISYRYNPSPHNPPSPPPRRADRPPRKPAGPPEEPENGHEPGTGHVLPPYIGLAEAYVPMQRFSGRTFDLEEALDRGTLFPELYRPYRGHYWEMR